MAKQTGLGDQLFVSGYDLSGDVGAVQTIKSSCGLLNVTGLDKSALERLYGVRDGEISFNCFYNPSTSHEHPVLKALPTSDIEVAYFHGSAIGNPAACQLSKQIDYGWARSQDGALMGSVQALATGGVGLEHCEQLTAGKRTDTGATNGASLDGGAATAFGLAAYLHVFSFAGTDVTVKLQDSANDSAFSDITAGGFAQITTAPGVQRIETGLTAAVRRYVRVATTTTGGFTSLVFAVAFVRYTAARDP